MSMNDRVQSSVCVDSPQGLSVGDKFTIESAPLKWWEKVWNFVLRRKPASKDTVFTVIECSGSEVVIGPAILEGKR